MRKNLVLSFIALLQCISVDVCAQTIIPKPNHFELHDGKAVLADDATIGYNDASLKAAAEYLAGVIRPATGYRFKTMQKNGTIMLKLDRQGDANGYRLEVSNENIVISSAGYRGIIAGIQSLRQLLPADIESRQKVSGIEWSLPCCSIVDTPRYDYRGILLDVSRHFFTKEEVKSMLDVMALYKLNKFHWHLTDDQGWRVEIKRYPKLTENGAWRKHNNHDELCNRTADIEQNEDMRVPSDRRKTVDGEMLYGGFYTQKDIREIVEYARVRGIDIIPEVDMPGHILAAEQNYPGISCFDEIGWGTFSSPACPGKDSAMEFCKNVYEEIVELFPYEYIHIGGDEVEKANWKKCPDCQKRMKDNGLKTEEELQSWFIHEMERFLNSKGKKMIGWNEIIEGGLSKTSTIMWWGAWVKDAPLVTATHGNDIINTRNDVFYLDYNEGSDAMKNIYDSDTYCGLPEPLRKHILGLQGNIWCERIPTMNRLWYQAANRMLAIAELGWSAAEPKNYYEFENRMLAQLPRFSQLGIRSKVMPLEGFCDVNAFVDEGHYKVTCKDPGVTIRYTTDGTIPTPQSKLLDGELVLTESTSINFAAFRKDGSRGDVVAARFNKDAYTPSTDITPAKNGLEVKWYDFAGINTNEIEKAEFKQCFITEDVVIPEGVKGNIGLIVSGYIYVPETGIYTFSLLSDDGSDLMIDNDMVVDMNREQSPTTSVGQKVLAAGYHPIRLRYFDHNGGTLNLVVTNSKGKILNPSEIYYSLGRNQ